ncbi:restriction endonuclease subunit S [Pseudorhodoferax sp. Leaf265]|uniref:restriction endonuclease subunit S n=1 Tax=Pseudorhodoferax sp. Leaf265 TaxID=1736315 RepID=UPI001F289345|nr:restriction endonuclease subunit S [Pseudorhodoferax sp. Leaf265]
MIRTTNIRNGRIDLSDCRFVDEATYTKWTRRAELRGGDVLLTREAPIGEVGLVVEPEGLFLGQRVMQYRADPRIVAPRFLLYSFLSPDLQHQFGSHEGSGSVVSHIRVGDCFKFKLRLPPLAVQVEIANLLGALDDRIALLRETNATLEAIAQALFKSWFVDFDPVRAKIQGLPPAGMDEATAALFPDGFEESALGSVPTGWAIRPIGDAVECIGGATPDTKDPSYWNPEEHAWTTPKDLSGLPAPVLLKTERRLSAKGLAKIGSGLLPAGTLLLSSRAPIGYLAIAQMPVAINQGYIAIPPGGLLPPLYVLFWCQQNMEGIKARANGSTFMEISKKAFRPILTLVPSPPVIEAFLAIASPLFSRLVSNEQQAQTLATLRDTLLPRLISGQLRLPEAIAEVEEIA